METGEKDRRRALRLAFEEIYRLFLGCEYLSSPAKDNSLVKFLDDQGVTPDRLKELVRAYWGGRGGLAGKGPVKILRETTLALGTIVGHLRVIQDFEAREKARIAERRRDETKWEAWRRDEKP